MHEHTKRENNFGILRLLFATLVIVSHSPELIDGNRSREILTQIFGTLSFGEVGVDGFFLISGYLITKSFVQRQSTLAYLAKRVLRIVPGYLASFWICVLVVAPFVGAGNPGLERLGSQMQQALLLLPPEVPGAFRSLHYPALNGAMWTIAYEFRCYLATIALGLLGLFKPRYRALLLILISALLLLNAAQTMVGAQVIGSRFIGDPVYIVRFGALYGVGMLFYLFRDRIRLTNAGALIAAGLLIPLFFNHYAAEAVFSICGGYLIFWFAFQAPVLRLSHIVNRADISYGLYLYAWPLQNLIIWSNKSLNPWLLCCLTLTGAGLLAYASWILVEKPSLRFAPGQSAALPSLGGTAQEIK
ncbi:MAG: acyltransferase [Pseudomonadota bacterium]